MLVCVRSLCTHTHKKHSGTGKTDRTGKMERRCKTKKCKSKQEQMKITGLTNSLYRNEGCGIGDILIYKGGKCGTNKSGLSINFRTTTQNIRLEDGMATNQKPT